MEHCIVINGQTNDGKFLCKYKNGCVISFFLMPHFLLARQILHYPQSNLSADSSVKDSGVL